MSRRQRAAERLLHNQINILPKKELLVVFASLTLPLLICFIDQNGISVMLPTIAKSLHAENTISWAGTSSLIANTMFQMLYGRLSDIFGRKVVYISAIGCLVLAALLCGFAQNPVMFYVFRGIAGIGGGGISNLTMIIISDVVSLEEKGFYQGIVGAFIGLGNVLGPFIAAMFVTHATWNAFFWTTGPLAAVVGIISIYLIPPSPQTRSIRECAKSIDYGGVVLSSVGVIFLSIAISGGGAYFPWKSPLIISMLSIGSLSILLFILWEWKMAKLPMVPMDIFRSPTVCTMLTQCFIIGIAYQSYLYYLPLYVQNSRQFSIIQSAGVIAVAVGTQAVASIASAYYIARVGRWKLVVCAGFFLWTLAAGLVLRYDRKTSLGMIIGPLVIMGAGVGFLFQPTLTALQSHVTTSRRAVIISNRNFFRCAGGAAGLALSAAVLQATLRKNLPAEYQYLASSAYSLPSVRGPDFEAVLDAYMTASRAVFIVQVPLLGACLLACAFIKDHGLEPLKEREETDEAKADEESPQENTPDPSSSQSFELDTLAAGQKLTQAQTPKPPAQMVAAHTG